MSEKNGTSRWDDMLICEFCKEILTDNRRLSCMHAFCRKCLEEIKKRKPKSKKINCNICEKETVLPKGGVVNLTKNSFLEKLVYVNSMKCNKNLSKACEICPDSKTSKATRYCHVCYQNMCDACDNQHKKIKATRNHRIVQLRTDEHYKAVMKKPEVCIQHDTEIELICVDCKQAICSACLKTDHEFHKSRDIESEAENIKRTLRTYLENMSERISRERALFEELRREEFEYNKDISLEKQKISDVAKSLIQRITSVESELIAQLKAISEISTKSSNLSRTALEDDIRILDMHRNYLEQLLTIGSSLDLYQDEKLNDYCKELISSPVPNKTFQNIPLHKENELRDYFITAILGELHFSSSSAKLLPALNEFYRNSRTEEATKNDVQAFKTVTSLDEDDTSSGIDLQDSTLESSKLFKSDDAKITLALQLAKKVLVTSPETSDKASSMTANENSIGKYESNSSLLSSTSSKLPPAKTTPVLFVAKKEVHISPKMNDNTSPRSSALGICESNSFLSSSTSSKIGSPEKRPELDLVKKDISRTPKIDDNTSPNFAKQTSPLGVYGSNSSILKSTNPKSELTQDDMKHPNLVTYRVQRQSQSKLTHTTRKSMENSSTSKDIEDLSNTCITNLAIENKLYPHDRGDSFLNKPNIGHRITLPNHTSPASEISSNDLSIKSSKTAKRASAPTETLSKPNELEEAIPVRGRVRSLIHNINENHRASALSITSDELPTKGIALRSDNVRSRSSGDRGSSMFLKDTAVLNLTPQKSKNLQPPKLLDQYIIKLDINAAVTGVAASDIIVYFLQEKSSKIHVFSLVTQKLENPIPVKYMTNPKDMAICNHHKCLYISDWSTFKVYRVDLKNNNVHSWSCDHDYGSLSVTTDYHVLLTRYKTGKIAEFDTNGKLIQTVDVRCSDFMQIYPWHAMQFRASMFVVSFGDEKSGVHGLILTDSIGTATKTLKSIEVEERSDSKAFWNRAKSEERKQHGSSFSGIFHLAIRQEQWILAIDCNNSRILLLNDQLQIQQELVSSKYLHKPSRMFLDELNGRLYVADNQLTNNRPHSGQIKVFDIRECNF